ncbi:phosphatidylserine decarboxylase [uncultured Clostridium sp.]|jgi:phosphatidylserine decarboxylase|uniref:phosphatidylserine decarboxylase n=1 Tax=uncultured Clostridium sp. TaxID=59620 RepID=UPI0026269BA4|nr:phosphatidylserine decarboxylase [uncultured Clostridium sp.]
MFKIYNRETKCYEVEQVAGLNYINWSYSSPVGKGVLELFIKKKMFSKIYGLYCSSKFSKKKIPKFIDKFDIDTDFLEKDISEFKNFNDFFARKLLDEARPITSDTDNLISPGDGRLLGYENINMDNIVQVKGFTYSLRELISNDLVAKEFEGGTCLILRLCPTDYHRFHFIDDGVCGSSQKIKGAYYSVNPIALEKVPNLFCKNKREWSIFKSKNFGNVITMEVGATCVGTIIQSYRADTPVKKGDEKGFFKFGGSTTILFFKKNIIKIDNDIVRETEKGFESLVTMGETIGKKYK